VRYNAHLMTSISLRPITPADEDFLFNVYASTRADEMARVDWNDIQKESFLRMQFQAQHQYYVENYVGADFSVIMQNDQAVGRLYIHRRDKEIRIMDIVLLPEYRKQGIGSNLLQDILQQGSDSQIPVTIHVERFNPALHLYERLGFRQKEDKGVYWLMERMPINKQEQGHAG
jgi:ribosomal protein S18 acetylase RimI-like enzyme